MPDFSRLSNRLEQADCDRPTFSASAAFGIRPEHVGLNSGAGWPFSASAAVEVVEPMGSDTLVWLKLAGQNFSVRVTSERAPRAGEMVTVGLDPLRASLFDDVGNRL